MKVKNKRGTSLSVSKIIHILLSILSILFLMFSMKYYNAAKISFQDEHQTTTITTTSSSSSSSMSKNLTKLIQPDGHKNVPHPLKRIGPDGQPGYKHDPKFIIRNPPSFHIQPHDKNELCKPFGHGLEGMESINAIQKIRQNVESSYHNNKDVKLFCAVYTYSGGINNTNAIRDTWGKRCDGLLFASDHSSDIDGHMHLPGDSRNYGFNYNSMYQRVRAMKAYIYDNFLNEYDFFHFCGDDTFMIVENMKEFLASDKVMEWDNTQDKQVIAGDWLHWEAPYGKFPPSGTFYLNGAPGYTLSRKALKMYVEGPMEACEWKNTGMEDLAFSECLRSQNYTEENTFINTIDDVGAHRYHPMNITHHSKWSGEQVPSSNVGMYMNVVLPRSFKYFEKEYGFPTLYKDDYVSNSSVIFHKTAAMGMRRMEMLLYRDIEKDCAGLL